jgi:TolA-binding protein
MNDLEPLEPKLHELLSRERDAYTEDSVAREAVLRHIQTAIVLAPLATAATASTAATAATAGAKAASAKVGAIASIGWKGAAFLTAIAFGGGVLVGEAHRSISDRTPSPAATSSPVVVQAPAELLPVPTIAPSHLPSAEPPSVAVSAPSATALAPTTRAPAGDPNEERALIDTARTALTRGRTVDAMTAIEDHTRRFPRGRLAEEREALAVQALALAGDSEGARARAERFRRAYPSSIFSSAVDHALTPFEEKKDAPP